MDAQTIIVILAAIVSVVFLAGKFSRSKGGGSCGCGCGSECPSAKGESCASSQNSGEK